MSTVTPPSAETSPSAALPSETDEPRSRPGTPVWELARFYPYQGEWTEEQYLALDTNHLVEFDNGVLEFLPMPELVHQLLSQFLFVALKEFVTARKLGTVLYAPYRIRIPGGKHREPDVLYVPKSGELHRRFTEDAAIVVEIVSEGVENRERDLVEKRADYAAAGIPEYWIVDPETKTVSVLTLSSKEYDVHGDFKPGETATSVLLDGFSVDVKACFAAADVAE